MLPSYLALLLENRRLRRQLEGIRHRQGASPLCFPHTLYHAGGYFSFFVSTLRYRVLYRTWRRVWAVFRPTLFVVRALRVLTVVLAVLQASAAALVFSAIFVLLLPALLFLSLAFFIAGAGANRRAVEALLPRIAGERVLLLFFDDRLTQSYRSLADGYGGTVFFVSTAPRALVGERMRFPAACTPYCGGYLITPRCYFRLRRHLSSAACVTLVF